MAEKLLKGSFGRWHLNNLRILGRLEEMEKVPDRLERKLNRMLVAVCFLPALAFLAGSRAVLPLLPGLYLAFRDEYRTGRAAARRMQDFRMQFPRLVSNYLIFLEAGYPVETALRRSCETGEPNLIKETILEAFREIDHGGNRYDAFAGVVFRVREPNLSKMLFLTNQGIRLGEGQMLRSLQMLADSCWKTQMDEMRIHSEKASAKMVFPMMLIFLGISILAMAPGLITIFGTGGI